MDATKLAEAERTRRLLDSNGPTDPDRLITISEATAMIFGEVTETTIARTRRMLDSGATPLRGLRVSPRHRRLISRNSVLALLDSVHA